jgi:hypothetical protein
MPEKALESVRHWFIYTDGIEIEGRVRAAAYCKKGGIREIRYLGTNEVSNILTAKFFAIILALKMLLKAKQDS